MSRSWNKVGQYYLNNYDKNWVVYGYMVVNLHIRVIHNGKNDLIFLLVGTKWQRVGWWSLDSSSMTAPKYPAKVYIA